MVAKTVRDFVEREVIPVATELEHRNEYPHALVETMKTLGLFGLNVPDEYGGNEIDYTTFAMVFEELSRGDGTGRNHRLTFGVVRRLSGSVRTTRNNGFCPALRRANRRRHLLSEPNAGTDLQAITTIARRDGDIYYVTGSKMWVTTGDMGKSFLLLVKTDPTLTTASRHQRL